MFVTWNVQKPPRSDKILVDGIGFERSLHSAADSRELQSVFHTGVAAEGVFVAGAWSVPGMGLLEEGTISAERAAAAVVRYLRAETVPALQERS